MSEGREIERLRSHPRQRYLAAAVEVAAGQSSRHFAVSHVTIGAVAAAAGVSRGALYRLWPSQQDFWNDLIEFLAQCPPGVMPSRAAYDPPPQQRRTEAFSDAAQHVLLADTLTLLRTATADDRPPGEAGQRLESRRAARLAHLADALTRRGSRRCVPGVAPTDLAAAVTALGSGLAVTGRMCGPEDLRFDSPWFDRPERGPRSMLGVATEAMLDNLTKTRKLPLPAPSEGDATGDPRAPAAGRRRAYLEMGARLAMTRDGTAPHRVLGHVTFDSVARAAGVSRRTVASAWPDQEAFRLDLFAYLLRADRAAVIAAVRTAAADHDPGRPAASAFREVGARMHRQLVAELGRPTFRAFATQLDEPSLAARAIAEHRRLADSCTMQLHRLLALSNRRMQAGVAGRQLAVLLFALSDGFATLLRTYPAAIRDDIRRGDDLRPHSTIAMVVEVVLDAFTERLDGSPEVNRYVALIS